MKIPVIKKKLRELHPIPPLGVRHTLVHWLNESDDDGPAPMVDLIGYGKLLEVLPDHIVENLEKARLARDGRIPMLKCGLGYEELLSSVIVDGTPIASSSTEAFLFPALLFPKNYLQPGGIPGRTIHFKARGRHTTLTTGATLTVKAGTALTNVIPTTTWAVSGPLTMDATVQTATQWFAEGMGVIRSVGSGGSVFCQGDATSAAQAFTIVNQTNQYMGSAGQATPAAVALDLTQDQYFSLTGKWSLATAYSITGHIFVVEALN